MKRNWVEIAAGIALTLGFSYGLGQFIDFWRAFAFVAPSMFVLVLGYVVFLKDILVEKKELSNQVIQEYDNLVLEQQQVIQEYEAILDTQYISIECECKKGKFEGFFDKSVENFVECDGCGNNYKITPSYDVVLLAEPLDLDNNTIFDKIKDEEAVKD